jgi:XTP/dITP diphosphohydrolase
MLPKTGLGYFAEGVCQGRISFVPKGDRGFGYDPVFIPDGYRQTFAQLTPSLKNRFSHRGRAIRQLLPILTHLILISKQI